MSLSRILVIGDPAESLQHALNALQAHQYLTTYLTTSQNPKNTVFAAVNTYAPDCIILDNDSVAFNGIKVARQLRHNAIETPLLLICDSSDPATIDAALAAGINECIDKPIIVGLLHNRIRHLLLHTKATHKKESTKQLFKEAKHSERLLSIGIMASGIAHEFNNLNTIILGNVELLQAQRNIPTAVSDRIANIHETVLRSKQATSNLLNFTRGNSNPSDLVQLQEIIQRTLSMLRGSFNQHAIHIETSIPPQPILVRGHADELSQVILNILINAIHALEDSQHKKITITLTADPDEDEACIKIYDNGCGFPTEHLGQVLVVPSNFGDAKTQIQKNQQTQPSDSSPALSTITNQQSSHFPKPIGLQISTAIIENHCGNICIESSHDSGTTVCVALPTCTDSHFYKNPPLQNQDSCSLRGKHILIADDEIHIRELLSDLLEEQGCQISTANNGKQVIAKLTNHPTRKKYDAIILDWQMPILDGTAVIDHMQDLAHEQQSPIIVISGWGTANLLNEQQKQFAPVCLAKPFKSDDIIQALKQTL